MTVGIVIIGTVTRFLHRFITAWLCCLAAMLGLLLTGFSQAQSAETAAGNKAVAPVYAKVVPGQVLQFPRDHGSHPDFRTEWWYVTGWLTLPDGSELGLQVTFFRNRPGVAEQSRSRFAPRQLLFAHAALALQGRGRLMHDQRAARAGLGLAESVLASAAGTAVHIDDWSLQQQPDGSYRASIPAREFELQLQFMPTQPLLLQGEAGFSRKGPQTQQASYYYSQPQMAVSGSLRVLGDAAGQSANATQAVKGVAWLDHEWSSEAMAAQAVGWDWVGLNMEDGGALMAFRLRDAKGGVVWAGGTHRRTDGQVQRFAPQDVRFEVLRQWRSPHSGASYPVAMAVVLGRATDAMRLELKPLMDDQELDARASTGNYYWEGAVRSSAMNAAEHSRKLLNGRGYLELTGYWRAQKL